MGKEKEKDKDKDKDKKKKDKPREGWHEAEGSHSYRAINGGWLVETSCGLAYIPDPEHMTVPTPLDFDPVELPPPGQGWG